MPHAALLLLALALTAPAALAQSGTARTGEPQTAARTDTALPADALDAAARGLPGATRDAVAGYALSIRNALAAPDRATRQLGILSARSRLAATLAKPLTPADTERLDETLGLATGGY